MLGLVLEGGGARGAFHIGAMKALIQHGYVFDGVVGTSIGAFNAAILCQGDFEQAVQLWKNIQPSVLFDVENQFMDDVIENKLNYNVFSHFTEKAKKSISNRGIQTDKLHQIVNEYIDENRIRQCKIDFGLVTVRMPEFQSVEIFLEHIPEGKLHAYIMASANFLGFRPHVIDGRYFIDGGVHNNCPINMLVEKGYQQVVAIRTSPSIDKSCKRWKKRIDLIEIIPSEPLGGILVFNNQRIRRNITMGYLDATRMIDGLKGKKYYIVAEEEQMFFQLFALIDDTVLQSMARRMGYKEVPLKRTLFEEMIPKFTDLLKLTDAASYQDILIGMLEIVAQKKEVERFCIYRFSQLVHEVQQCTFYDCPQYEKRNPLLHLKQFTEEFLGATLLEELATMFIMQLPLSWIEQKQKKHIEITQVWEM